MASLPLRGTVPNRCRSVETAELKPRSEWRMIGKGVPRRDTPEKVNGKAIFGLDINVPGMV